MPAQKPKWIGVDTPFLVAHTVIEHPEHPNALRHCEHLLTKNCCFALCPTVLDEFVHVVTDHRRFEDPLRMTDALEIAEAWLTSQEIVCLFPCERSTRLHLRWLHSLRLGRKRINDTRIASIYHQNGVRTLLTSNVRDYSVFDCFEILHLSDRPT